MAFPHHVVPSVRVGASRLGVRIAVAGLASLSALTLLPAAAHADPKVTAASAQAQLASLSDKAELLTEKFNAAQDKLSAAQHALSADQAAITKAQAAVDAERAQVTAMANAAYEAGGSNTLELLLSSGDPQAALDRAGMLSMLASRQGAQLRVATAASEKLSQTKAAATQQLKAIQALQAALASQQKTINALVAQQQALLKTSQAQIASDNAKANSAAKAAAAARAASALAASRAQTRASLSRQSAPRQLAVVPPSGRASAAVAYAYAQLGKPYRWAGAGPRSFDCSGLTMRAWQAAGVSLGHNAAGQYASTRHVARSQLQPGDLVYFGHPIHHVGIYIGNGNMIEAPYTGADVRITNFGYRHDYAGASRP